MVSNYNKHTPVFESGEDLGDCRRVPVHSGSNLLLGERTRLCKLDNNVTHLRRCVGTRHFRFTAGLLSYIYINR